MTIRTPAPQTSLPGDEDGGQEVPLTQEGAVALLQACERARQARQRARFLKEIRDQEEWERQVRPTPEVFRGPVSAVRWGVDNPAVVNTFLVVKLTTLQPSDLRRGHL